MNECVFCKIAQGNIPCHKVLENKDFLAFLDNRPFTEGHLLVIPRTHYRWVYDVPNFGEYWDFARQAASKIQSSLKPEYLTFLTMGNEVPHAHIHIIPRHTGDQLTGIFKEEFRRNPDNTEFDQTLAKIKSATNKK
ncbi:HIT family protein [Patescibacteria group bacterium]|nr:HIT family protein [Patescibacteria group bacterium]